MTVSSLASVVNEAVNDVVFSISLSANQRYHLSSALFKGHSKGKLVDGPHTILQWQITGEKIFLELFTLHQVHLVCDEVIEHFMISAKGPLVLEGQLTLKGQGHH